MNDGLTPERVLIFGATSAIAAEVAVLLAARGAQLILVGRNAQKLEVVTARCGAAAVGSVVADLGRPDTLEPLVTGILDSGPRIDTVLVAHGDLGDQLESERSFAEAERILRVNFTSVVALLIPIANQFEQARHGRIGVITSVAGDRGRPRNFTYGAAKGALNIYLQGLRSRLYPAGVTVTTLKLGPVDSPMTTNHTKSAVFSDVATAAHGVLRAMDAGAAEAYVPGFWAAIMPIVRSTPEVLFQRLPFLSGR